MHWVSVIVMATLYNERTYPRCAVANAIHMQIAIYFRFDATEWPDSELSAISSCTMRISTYANAPHVAKVPRRRQMTSFRPRSAQAQAQSVTAKWSIYRRAPRSQRIVPLRSKVVYRVTLDANGSPADSSVELCQITNRPEWTPSVRVKKRSKTRIFNDRILFPVLWMLLLHALLHNGAAVFDSSA